MRLTGSLWLALVLLALVLLAALHALDKRWGRVWSPHSHLDEAHHGYYGALILFGILAALTLPKWLVLAVAGVAALFLADDAFQHVMQVFGNGSYRSPLWRLWRFILTRFQ